ncbi:MAG: hypothetical protein AB1486_33740 [Planctomycetota bacterium]
MEPKEEEKYQDFLIDEVRERRRRLLADYDGDLGKLLEAIRRRQAGHPEKLSDLRKRSAGRS